MERMEKPSGIIVHHSLTKDGNVEDWASIRRYHMEEKGWDDIGYHGGVERIQGKIFKLTGRPVRYQGAHTVGHNNTLGICIVGNFDDVPPDADIFKAGVDYVVQWMIMYPHLTLETVQPHHKYADKSCPGKLFPMDDFRNSVANMLAIIKR